MLSKLQSLKMSIAIAFTSFIPFLELKKLTFSNFSHVFLLFILVLPLTFIVKWHISDWKYGDKWLVISPPIVNLGFLINDLIYSFENNIEIFTSIYFEMVQITFVSYIVIYFIFMTIPNLTWSLYLEPYHHIWYTLTMVQASLAGLISSDYILDFSIISLIVLIVIILFEKHRINQVEQVIVNQLELNKNVDLYNIKNVSWVRFFNPIKLAYLRMKLQNKIEDPISSMIKINRMDEIIELSIENNAQIPLISYFDESNLFLRKGKLLKLYYSRNDNAEKDYNFFNRTLKVVLLTTTILFISLIDFGVNSDLLSNLMYLQILLFVIYLLYFFYYHPSFKDILPALFGDKKIIIYEKGIEINIDRLEGELRYIRFIDIQKLAMNKELKELRFNFGNENIVIKLDEFDINSAELHEIENLIKL